jgi:TonB family protein
LLAALLMLMQAPPPQPRPPHVQGLISADDYPPRAMANGEEGTVVFDALIAPDGSVDKCTIAVSSGHSDLDDATCRIVKARARFVPARDGNGAAVYGIFRNVINWSLGNLVGGHLEPELELQINQAPAGVTLPLVMTLSYVSRADGSAGNCGLDSSAPGTSAPPPPQVLVDLACNSIVTGPRDVVRNSHGQPVAAKRTMTARFSLGR